MISLILLLIISINALKVEDIPSPNTNPMGCGRHDPSFICSPDRLLSDQVMGWFDVYVKDLRKKESYCREGKSGYQIGTAWIRQMELNSGETKENAARRYAITLHNRWGIGDRDCNNGIMIFVSIDDRQMYISVGAGATDQLSNSNVLSVIDEMRNYLRNEDNDGALQAGVKKIDYYLFLSKSLSPEVIVLITLVSLVFLIYICWCVWYYLDDRRKHRHFDIESYISEKHSENETKSNVESKIKSNDSKEEYVSKLRIIEEQ